MGIMYKKYAASLVFITILFLSYFCSLPVQARWASYQDAPAEIESYTSDVVIDKEGKSEETIEKQIKILNESGRSAFGVERIHFNGNIEKVEIIKAKTIVNGKEYTVPKETIEIKPLASEISGFDQLFQILISYPHVSVGSQLYLKYKVRVLKQPLPHYFSIKYYYGEGLCWKKAKLKVKSALPFHIKVNDPHRRLDLKKRQEGKYQSLTMTSTKPAYDDLQNEPQSNQIPDTLKTWVSLSTFDKYADLSKAFAKGYETVINQPLPYMMESIRKAAKDMLDPVDQINKVTSLLAEKVRYMGDWRAIEGRFAPRPLKDIETSGVGDCKDFAAATAATLKALGYKAQVAIVMRAMAYLPQEKSLPSASDFNHAIVKVTTKDGKVFWIDPTNFVSMADGIFPDISDRPVLVLDTQNPSYETIPPVDFKHSQTHLESTLEIKDSTILKTEGTLRLCGEEAHSITGAALTRSSQSIEEEIIQFFSEETSPIHKKVILPLLDSRIVKDIVIQYAYEQENNLLLTNVGVGILLRTTWSKPFLDTSEEQEGTTFLGLPATIRKKTIIKDVSAEQIKDLTYEVNTPWVKAKRECRTNPQGIELEEFITILKSFISAQDVKSNSFQELKATLKKFANKIAVISSNIPNELRPF